jgi:hypothetical protein
MPGDPLEEPIPESYVYFKLPEISIPLLDSILTDPQTRSNASFRHAFSLSEVPKYN